MSGRACCRLHRFFSTPTSLRSLPLGAETSSWSHSSGMCFVIPQGIAGRKGSGRVLLLINNLLSVFQLFVLLGAADGQSKLTSEQNAISLPPGKYRHLDRATNKELICDKCPAGTYVSKHCTKSTLRECSPCPDGTFTKHENGIERCHSCRKPCELPMIEKTRCTALTDRECTCLSGTFQTNDTCVPYTVCPVGWGVRKKGTETEDVRCKPCPRGTFSDVPSSVMKCKTYTDCFAKNMVVIKPGTKESDNVCGSPASLPNTSLTSSSTEADEEPYEVPPTSQLPKGNVHR